MSSKILVIGACALGLAVIATMVFKFLKVKPCAGVNVTPSEKSTS